MTRDTILDIMSEILQDGDVINWGTQCNRAIRNLFPMVFIKRKGKFKSYPLLYLDATTVFN